jgi:hypothetical protein
MNELAKLIPAKIRKTIYAVAVAVNGIALIVLPLIANLGLLDGGVAQQVTATIGQILAFIAGIVAIPNIASKQNTAD